MSGAPTPPVLLEAIASAAAPGFITNPIPEAPTGTNAASITGGYPPKTMQSELAGGLPPLGQDMNGYLFLISSHTVYAEAGQLYLFNSTFAAAIAGYKVGSILGMSDNTGIWLNILDGNTNDPDAGGAGWVPLNAYGVTNVTGLTGGTVVLSVAQAKYGVITLSGSLVSNLTIQLPQSKRQWLIINGTTGSFTTTIITTAGGSSGVTIAQGGFSAPLGVYSVGDGNIYPTVAPVSLPIDQAPNPLTIAQRTNAGYLLATYFNQNSGLEAPTIGAVIVQNSAADGFFRKISITNFEAQLLLQNMGGLLVNSQVPPLQGLLGAVTAGQVPALSGLSGSVTAGQVPLGAVAQFFGETLAAKGHVVLPDGWKVNWGFSTGIAGPGGSQTQTFESAFTTQCYGAVITPFNAGGTAQSADVANGYGLGSFNITNNASITRTFFWIAIGK